MPRRSSSGSPSRSKKKPTGPVTANLAITATLVWFAVIAVLGLIVPSKLMEIYQIPLESLQKNAKDDALVTLMFQNWICWMLVHVGVMSITRRVGNKKSEGLCCLANIVAMVLFLAVGEWKNNAMWVGLDMPESSVWFNRILFSCYVVLNFFGWQAAGQPLPDINLALDTSSDLASKWNNALSLVFGCAMLFAMDTLFEVYKFDPTAASKEWIYAIFTGFGTTLLSNMASLTIMLSADKKTKTQINRWLWCFFAMQVISSCLMQTMFLKILCPEIDPKGQMVNIGLWLSGATLAWKQMIA